jgi:predicted site-specific integrase-resolvase
MKDRIRVDGEELLSAEGVALVLGIHRSRAFRLLKEGVLPVAHEANGKRYVKRSDVTAYRERRDGWLKMHGRARPRLQRISA